MVWIQTLVKLETCLFHEMDEQKLNQFQCELGLKSHCNLISFHCLEYRVVQG